VSWGGTVGVSAKVKGWNLGVVDDDGSHLREEVGAEWAISTTQANALPFRWLGRCRRWGSQWVGCNRLGTRAQFGGIPSYDIEQQRQFLEESRHASAERNRLRYSRGVIPVSRRNSRPKWL
jgi:hypothetical protein